MIKSGLIANICRNFKDLGTYISRYISFYEVINFYDNVKLKLYMLNIKGKKIPSCMKKKIFNSR